MPDCARRSDCAEWGMADLFIALAAFLLLGLVAHYLGLRTRLPRVTLLILAGVAIGPTGMDWFAGYREQLFPMIADMALVMLGFLIGGSLTRDLFQQQGRQILWLSLGIALVTFLVVCGGLLAVGQGLVIAVTLGAIATATDPAATADVLLEERDDRSPFGRLLLGIVALDDAWGLLIFSLALVVAIGSSASNGHAVLAAGLWEIAGAVLLGLMIGLPMAFLTGRIRRGEPLLIEALGLVLLCAGLAMRWDVSHLLASIVMGATVANLASHHKRPFHAIEGIQWPFLLLFFILAGASLQLHSLLAGGLLGGAYILLRTLGKISGGLGVGLLTGTTARTGLHSGSALLPQAGVAVAMALNASQNLAEQGQIILTMVLASTVVFELLGPLATRWALRRECRPLPRAARRAQRHKKKHPTHESR